MTPIDYRRLKAARKQTWFGGKKYAKRALAVWPLHPLVKAAARLVPKLRESGRLPAPRGLREVRGMVGGHRFVMLDPQRCIIAKELYWGNGRRPRRSDHFALEAFSALARDVDVVFDVGAYTGVFTILAAMINPNAKVEAFEIVPEVYQTLLRNCVRNDILHRVTLNHAGLGDPNTLFRVPATSRESALPSFYSADLRFETGVRIKFVSLDSCDRLVAPKSKVLIKIDVEGTESEIFRHGRRFISSFKPDFLCEILAEKADARAVQSALAAEGYGFFLVGDGTLRPMPAITPDPRYRDWLFTTRPLDELKALGLVDPARGPG